jgi:hypothetical protein
VEVTPCCCGVVGEWCARHAGVMLPVCMGGARHATHSLPNKRPATGQNSRVQCCKLLSHSIGCATAASCRLSQHMMVKSYHGSSALLRTTASCSAHNSYICSAHKKSRTCWA